MKKIPLLLLFTIFSITAFAQRKTLYEDFNSSCPSTTHNPPGWVNYNVIPGTWPDGAWTCGPESGKGGTPGISCTGYYGSPARFHLDTAYLVTPSLDLHDYPGNIFINFDTKTTNFNLGAKIAIIASQDSAMGTTHSGDTQYQLAEMELVSPLFTNGDSSDWVTHQANLTSIKNIVPLYISFRYTSQDGTVGNTWYIDNVNLTPFPSNVRQLAALPLEGFRVSGNALSGILTLTCSAQQEGTYDMGVYDIMGREVYRTKMQLRSGTDAYSINDTQLSKGVYFVKMSNGSAFGATKIMVY